MSGSCSPASTNYDHDFKQYLAEVLPILHMLRTDKKHTGG